MDMGTTTGVHFGPSLLAGVLAVTGAAVESKREIQPATARTRKHPLKNMIWVRRLRGEEVSEFYQYARMWDLERFQT